MKSNSNRGKYHQEHLIPEEELKCIWMNAGIISYKLCEYQYECEKCAFDTVMRRHGLEVPSLSVARLPRIRRENKIPEGQRIGQRVVDDLLTPFRHCMPQENRHHHFGHTWVDIDPPERAKIGLDSFAVRLLPQGCVVLTQAPQSHAVAGQPCCWIIRDHHALSVLAPLSGLILSVNAHVSNRPELLYQDPYGQGWLMTIRPDNLHHDLSHLMFGDTVPLWYQQDMTKLRQHVISILEEKQAIVGQTLCDGGENHADLCGVVGLKRYFEIISTLFHERMEHE